MLDNFDKLLAGLKDSSVRVSGVETYPQFGKATLEMLFSEGSRLVGDYWRLTKDGKAGIGSFDHQQKYGLLAAIDAIRELENEPKTKRLLKLSWTRKLEICFFTSIETLNCRY